MHQKYVLGLTLFPFLMLLFLFLSIRRAAESDNAPGVDANSLAAARKARRAALIMAIVISICSWIAAAILYMRPEP